MSDDPRRTTDEIRIIRAKQSANDTVLLIQAVARAVMALVIILVGAYLLISQIPIPSQAWPIALAVVGAYFGVESVSAFLKRRNGK